MLLHTTSPTCDQRIISQTVVVDGVVLLLLLLLLVMRVVRVVVVAVPMIPTRR